MCVCVRLPLPLSHSVPSKSEASLPPSQWSQQKGILSRATLSIGSWAPPDRAGGGQAGWVEEMDSWAVQQSVSKVRRTRVMGMAGCSLC